MRTKLGGLGVVILNIAVEHHYHDDHDHNDHHRHQVKAYPAHIQAAHTSPLQLWALPQVHHHHYHHHRVILPNHLPQASQSWRPRPCLPIKHPVWREKARALIFYHCTG